MDIGNDDFDLMDEDLITEDIEKGNKEDSPGIEPNQQNQDQEDADNINNNQHQSEDFIDSLLRERGIEDKSKIKFENDNGEVDEVNWDDLNNEEKLNILNSSTQDPDTDIDDDEAELINAIRESGLTPAEYLDHLQQLSINSYIQNNTSNSQYQIDQYSDDELFIFDFISRMGDVTDEEAQEALERAKSNPTLYEKQINAIRNEYRTVEEENLKQAQIEQEEQAKEEFNQFASKIEDEIDNFTEFSGYDLNLDTEDKDTLYDFITGTDGAGNNYFAKALSDPKILVQTAWFALNGKQMMDDITQYFQNEIKQVRKESYNKGLADAKAKMNNSSVVFTDSKTGKQTEVYNDLDDF